jgi:hypothetical protein
MTLIKKQNHLSYEMKFEKSTLTPSPETIVLMLTLFIMPLAFVLPLYFFSYLREIYNFSNFTKELITGVILLSPILSLYFPCKLYKYLTK